MTLWIAVILVVAGIALLWFSANRFVVGASSIARNLGIPPLVIGMALLGFATSLPEVIVATVAALNGKPEVGIGSALGSNIANIGLVLGLTTLISPITVHSNYLKREFPLLLIVTAGTLLLLLDGNLSRSNGVLLLLGFLAVFTWLTWQALSNNQIDPLAIETLQELSDTLSTARAMIWVVVGLIVLIISSRMLVDGAVFIAKYFGVSDLVIGLTIVAVGTSLPELAASVVSAYKGEPDLALGNVLGSNMFNLLVVMAMPGLFAPGHFSRLALYRDYSVMMSLTILLFIMAYGFRQRHGRITRWEGGILLCGYLLYLVCLL